MASSPYIEENIIQTPQEPQNEEWIVVTKNKHKHKGKINNKIIHNRGTQNIFSPQSQQDITQLFINSKHFQLNQQIIENTLLKISSTQKSIQVHTECLGLGNFLTNKKSYIQLQFFQLILSTKIKNILLKNDHPENQKRPLNNNIKNLSINMYDPAFSKSQINLIKQKSYEMNEKFQIKERKVNVFFMPHCQRFLYEAVYQKYEKIENKDLTPLIVIGNSISEYKQRCMLIKEKIPDIFLKLKVSEQKIFDYQNALNDTYIMLL